MSELPCIRDLSLVKEELKEDILKGKSLDILLLLLSGKKTSKEIARTLKIPVFSTHLYLKRLLDAEMIKIEDTDVVNGKLEKTYSMISKDLDILNNVKEKTLSSDEELKLSAEHFSSLVKDAVLNINNNNGKPHKIKAYYIKSDEKSISNFKEELESLFVKYQELENLECEDTYGFVAILSPIKI